MLYNGSVKYSRRGETVKMFKANKRLKNIGRIILLAVISLIIGLRFYSWNAKTLAGNAMPMPFGVGASVVLSGSMQPALNVNDLVFVRKAGSYQVDDIVVYQSGNSLVIHRIRSIDGDVVITKGDYNNGEDDPISLSDIKGKAVGHIPAVGALVRFFKSPVGFILLLFAAAALFELPHLREKKRVAEEQERIKEEIRRLKGE